jgi:hypothetical protein
VLAVHHLGNSGGIGAVAAEEAMRADEPQVAGAGDRLPRRLGRFVVGTVFACVGDIRRDIVIQRREQALDLVLVEAEQAEVVGLAVEGVDLRRQRLFVPGCGERQLVVADAIGPRLRVGKVRKPNDRENSDIPRRIRGLKSQSITPITRCLGSASG